MAGKIRTLIESKEYAHAFAKIGSAKRLDSAIEGLTWAIATNPGDFPYVPGVKEIRLAKTDPIKGLPSLIIWFSVLDTDTILLHFIETSKESSK
jgi:hypothetical protein